MVGLTSRGKAWRAFVALALLATTLAGTPSQLGAQAPSQAVQITVENLQGDGGFFLTSMWAGLHGGDFDLFDSGAQPTPGLEALAEDGNPDVLQAEFDAPGRLQTQVGPTPIAPGSTHTASIDVINASAYPYLSIASMLLPSNDAFFGNEAPDAYQVFNADGTPAAPLEITIYADNVYDAGTEANNVMGLPFVPAAAGTDATETTDGIALLSDGLSPYVGAETAAGTTIADELSAGEALARITVEVVDVVVPDAVFIEVENLQGDGGFFFTSMWAGLHNGDFDLFDSGDQPTPGLEALAEDGNPDVLQAEFDAPGRLQTQVGPTPIAPGSVHESSIDIINAAAYRYVSFASMLLPSNDAFFGNGDPLAYELFDADGVPTGPIEITIFADNVYDSGTEANNVMGLPFVPAAAGTDATETSDGIALLSDGLSPYVGAVTAAGTTIADELSAGEEIARITIYAGPARTCGGYDVTVNLAAGEEPTDGDDVILGTDGDDVIDGLAGNDVICGEGGDDTINAGAGRDMVLGGEGNDTILGGRGPDTIYGQGGEDMVAGGKGNDTIAGGGDDDYLRGNRGNDVVHGNAGSDIIAGGSDDDRVVGGQGSDTLAGNAGDDIINGGNGNDSIAGGRNADVIQGQGGADDLRGNNGPDTILFDADDTNVDGGGQNQDTLEEVS